MRTVRCSGRVLGGGGVCPRGVSAKGGMSAQVGVFAQYMLPPREQDRHLLKHNLSATTLRTVMKALAYYLNATTLKIVHN